MSLNAGPFPDPDDAPLAQLSEEEIQRMTADLMRRIETASPTPPEPEKPVAVGDYVLATDRPDGDHRSPWCVGWVCRVDTLGDGSKVYDVANAEGVPFRPGGLARAERITEAEGKDILDDMDVIGRPLWEVLHIMRGGEDPNTTKMKRLVALVRQHISDDARLTEILEDLAYNSVEDAIRTAEAFTAVAAKTPARS